MTKSITPRHFLTKWTFLLWGILLVCAGCKTGTPPWQPVEWRGETAWAADSGDWRAVVSNERGRLVYLGPKDGDTNLLYAPALPQESFRQRGGHIFWLGPQTEWKGKWGTWPPPDEWEQRPAQFVQPDREWLRLTMSRPDKSRPQLTRAYRWKDGALLCETAWAGGSGDHQAIQILQLPLSATVEARQLSTIAPGFVRFDTKGNQSLLSLVLGDEVSLMPGRVVRLAPRAAVAKFGFSAQTLHARIGVYGMEFIRGEIQGGVLDAPDQGFETQVFLGNEKYPFIEMEQLTPRLKNRGDAPNVFTVLIKLRKLDARP